VKIFTVHFFTTSKKTKVQQIANTSIRSFHEDKNNADKRLIQTDNDHPERYCMIFSTVLTCVITFVILIIGFNA
jgi:hypothetical protein